MSEQQSSNSRLSVLRKRFDDPSKQFGRAHAEALFNIISDLTERLEISQEACAKVVKERNELRDAAYSAELKRLADEPPAASVIPREPSHEMMQAGLYHSSHDSEYADVHSIWVNMWDKAAGASEPPPAWQPIETAPQGDAIVWLPDKGAVMARLCGDLWYDLTTGWLCEPTLWAPMPAGPSETKKEHHPEGLVSAGSSAAVNPRELLVGPPSLSGGPAGETKLADEIKEIVERVAAEPADPLEAVLDRADDRDYSDTGLGKMLRAYKNEIRATTLRNAERWRALVGCARVRIIGSAGIRFASPTGKAHVAVEFWTHHDAPTHPSAIEDLITFADRVAQAKSVQPKLCGNPLPGKRGPCVMPDGHEGPCDDIPW